MLSAVEQSSLCAGVATLLPLLRPSDHYLSLVRPLAAALQAGAAPPPGPLAALGPSLGGQTAGRPDPAEKARTDDTSSPAGEKTPSLAAVIRQQNRETARALSNGRASLEPPRVNGAPSEHHGRPDDAADDRTAAGTPPPPDDDADMGSESGPELDPAAVLDLFQSVWNYVNTCW